MLEIERLEERFLLTNITGKAKFIDEDGDVLYFSLSRGSSADLHDSEGGDFEDGERLGNVFVYGSDKKTFTLKNLGGGDKQTSLYGVFSSNSNMKAVSLSGSKGFAGVDSHDAGISAPNLGSVAVNGDLRGNFNFSAGTLGKFSAWSANGLTLDVLSSGSIASTKGNLENLAINGSVKSLKAKQGIYNARIGNETSEISSVSSKVLDNTVIFGQHIGKVNTNEANSLDVVAVKAIDYVKIKNNCDNSRILAGLNLGADRIFGTSDDRWHGFGTISKVYLGSSASRVSNTAVSVAFSLDDMWGNGDERVVGDSSLGKVYVTVNPKKGGSVDGFYAGSGERFYVKTPDFTGWVDNRFENSRLVFEVAGEAEEIPEPF